MKTHMNIHTKTLLESRIGDSHAKLSTMSEKTSNLVEIIDLNGAVCIDLLLVVFWELRLLRRISCDLISDQLDAIIWQGSKDIL